jgi:hypothetical protein
MNRAKLNDLRQFYGIYQTQLTNQTTNMTVEVVNHQYQLLSMMTIKKVQERVLTTTTKIYARDDNRMNH